MNSSLPDPMEVLIAAGQAVPWDLVVWHDARRLTMVRYRLNASQKELAARIGTAQSQLSRLESGEDALLGTWRRVYAALGFETVLLLPITRLGWKELRDRFDDARPGENLFRFRARPRANPPEHPLA
jgi:transcriptional regulator with XRE-family HTH domain